MGSGCLGSPSSQILCSGKHNWYQVHPMPCWAPFSELGQGELREMAGRACRLYRYPHPHLPTQPPSSHCSWGKTDPQLLSQSDPGICCHEGPGTLPSTSKPALRALPHPSCEGLGHTCSPVSPPGSCAPPLRGLGSRRWILVPRTAVPTFLPQPQP